MSLLDELTTKVKELSSTSWGEIPNGRVVPTPESLTFGNTGIRIEACVLYADIHKSTEMVQTTDSTRAAEYYKAFLYCAAKIIKSHDGTIVAYDGDRVMAIFMGYEKADRAIKTAFELYWVVDNVINVEFNKIYYLTPYTLKHTVGIDVGQLLASKTGVRVDSDIVWVGNAANHASKLNSFSGMDITKRTRITSAVWTEASASLCFDGVKAMWSDELEVNGIRYRNSSYWRNV